MDVNIRFFANMNLRITISYCRQAILVMILPFICLVCQNACGQSESNASEPAFGIPMEPITLESSSSQPSSRVDNDFRLWLPSYILMPIRSKKLKVYMEVVPRLGDNVTRLNQFLMRNQIWWQPTDRLNFQAGYVWSTVFQPQRVQDNRITAESNYAFALKRLKFFNRLRLEERLIEHLHGTAVRLRYRLYLLRPLYKQYLQLVASNELFINLNSVNNGPRKGIDENRFFAGFRIRPLKYTACEIGYMQQYLKRDLVQDQLNHIVYIGVAQDI